MHRYFNFPKAWPALLAILFSYWGHWVFSAEIHEHGFARMEITYIDQRLEILLDTPAENVLGFERAPRNKRDREVVKQSYDDFLKKVKLNLPPSCRRDTLSFQGNGFKSDEDFRIAFGPSKGGQHSDLEITFLYQCSPDGEVREIDFETLFTTFKSFQKIEADIVSGDNFGFQQITPHQPVIQMP